MQKYLHNRKIRCIFTSYKNNKNNRIMRKEFVETESRYMAKKACPWASRTAKVCGGFFCFESITDYETWKNQK